MPHLTVEYSSNLEDKTDIDALVKMVHETALSTGMFPMGGIRVRTEPRQKYLIADGDPENAFLHLVARIGHGRTLEAKKEAAQTIFDALCEYLNPVFESSPLAISFEVQEIYPPELSFKKNNLHEKLQRENK